jgi:hypothetical protein
MDYIKLINEYDCIEIFDDNFYVSAIANTMEYLKDSLYYADTQRVCQKILAKEYFTFGEMLPRQSGKTTKINELATFCIDMLDYFEVSFIPDYKEIKDLRILSDDKGRTVFLVSDTGLAKYKKELDGFAEKNIKFPPLTIKLITG